MSESIDIVTIVEIQSVLYQSLTNTLRDYDYIMAYIGIIINYLGGKMTYKETINRK